MKFEGETISFQPQRMIDSQMLALLGFKPEQAESVELPFEQVHAMACSALAKSRAGYRMDERDVVAWELQSLYRIPETERDTVHHDVISTKEARLAELHIKHKPVRDLDRSSEEFQERIAGAEALMQTLDEFNMQRLRATINPSLTPELDTEIDELLDQEASSITQ